MENNNRKATQVEAGWRTAEGTGEATSQRATQVDSGWRRPDASGQATQIDDGWRASAGGPATEVDDGWRRDTAEASAEATVANSFATLDSFKDAVEKLTELKTSTGNVYTIKNTISRAGGESIILLCSDAGGTNVAAKVYYNTTYLTEETFNTRKRILDYMSTPGGKQYSLAVSEIGIVTFGQSNYYFEIMPYCSTSDLSTRGAFSFDKLVEITRQLNEALHSVHQAGIIHRDIKPENMYEIDGQIKLGDFGIAKKGAVGRSNVTEHILGTEGYAAPETRRYIYHEKSDYYSLGVTLATLFEGHFVFDNMNYEMQALAQESEKLPLMRVDPNRPQLENLLNGLCRLNAKQRFGYEEVKRWLADHNYSGGTSDEEWPKAYRILGDSYRDEESMFRGITKDAAHWEEAKVMLYSKIIEQFFVTFRTDLARSAQMVDEKYRANNRDKGLAVFLKTLYPAGSIVWKGYSFSGLEELGGKMVATQNPAAYAEILQNNCVSHWLGHTDGINADENTLTLVKDIEAFSVESPEIACYWFGNTFAPEKKLNICGHTVSTIEELVNALFVSPSDFYQKDGYDKLYDRVTGADLYGFLYSFGYKNLIEKSAVFSPRTEIFNKVSALLAMLENIAEDSGVDCTIIRSFFVEYGPVGIATYTKKLVERTQDGVYMPLDAESRVYLDNIFRFKNPSGESINALLKGYAPLIKSVEALRENLIENPHCILAGVYENKGVICTNLIGCFAFKIFGRFAPLGFNAWIESAKGGKN